MPPLPADAHIGEVTLKVSDLDRSLAFYTEVIGLALHGREGGTAALGPAGGRILVRLETIAAPVRRPPGTSGLFHVALLVPDRAALGRSLRRLAAVGWPLTGAADHLVSEAIYLDDPDGLGLEIYRDRPAGTWRRERDEVVMATERLSLDEVAAEPGADAPWRGVAAGTSIGHVHLQVPDLAGAEARYCDDLGFTVMLRRFRGALFVSAGGYHHHLGLNVWAGAGAPPPPGDAPGLGRFTIEGHGLSSREVTDPDTGVAVSLVHAG